VQLVADAVGSRRPIEKATALSRLSQRGAEITTTKMTLLEWTESRSAPAFSQLLGSKHKTGSRYHVDPTGSAPDTEIGKDGDLRNAADIGRLLRQSRLDRKITLKQLAEVAGCSLSQLSKIENNKAIPSLPLLKRLSAVLDRDMKSFLLES
jgi:DNA-binding XRE family transcriptional regulator